MVVYMFFIMGVSTKEEKIDFNQTEICPNCDSFSRLELFMTYSYLMLFFIPVFKWNRKYYVKSSCCNSLYTIDKELGESIRRGRVSRINPEDLHTINQGYRSNNCPNCTYPLEADYAYCPRCGTSL